MTNPALGLFKQDREPKSCSEVRPLTSDEYAKYIHVISVGSEPMIERTRHGHRL